MLGHPLSKECLQATRTRDGARDRARATISGCLSSIAESAAIASTICSSITVAGALINSLSALGTDSEGLWPRLFTTAFAQWLPNNLPLNLPLLYNVNMVHNLDCLDLRNGPDSFAGDLNLLEPLDRLVDGLLPVFVLGLRAGLALRANDLSGMDNSCEMNSLSPFN